MTKAKFSTKAPQPQIPSYMRPKADASMYLHDFVRWAKELETIVEYSIYALSGSIPYLKPYYRAMWAFWVEISKFIKESFPEVNDSLANQFLEIKQELDNFEAEFQAAARYNQRIYPSNELIEKLATLHVTLFEIKQKVNLGVWVSKPVSEEESLMKGI